MQAYFTGPQVAGALTELFRGALAARGRRRALELPEPRRHGPAAIRPRGALPFPRGATVALSRTEPRLDERQRPGDPQRCTSTPSRRAERFIYIETQYFSSRTVCRALADRMRDAERPRLEIVLVLNPRPRR